MAASTGRISVEIIKGLEAPLTALRARVEAIEVKDQQGYIYTCELVKEGRSYIKDVGFKLDPGINSAREHLDFLRAEKQKYIGPAQQIVSIAEKKGEEWKAKERRKAAAEEERVNAQRRAEAAQKAELERQSAEAQAKADRERRERELAAARKAGEINKREEARLAKQAAEAEEAARTLAAKQCAEAAVNVQDVKVLPSVPKVAGIRARVNWKFRIVDESKIPRQWMVPNEVTIGAFVRQEKKAGEVIPGIEAYSEDSI